MSKELIDDLRHLAQQASWSSEPLRNAADALESQAREIERLSSVIDKAWNKSHHLESGGYIPGALDAWQRPVLQCLPYDFSGNSGASATQYCNGWNDAGGYWKAHADDLLAELAALKAQPSGVVLPPHCTDRTIPVKYRKGWNCCISEVARLNQPASAGVYSADPLECSGCVSGCFRCGTEQTTAASAGDDPIRYWFIGDAGQEAGSRHCKKSTRDGSLALFESEHDAKRAARRHPGTEVYPVEYYRSPQARAALSANHSEQVLVPRAIAMRMAADAAQYDHEQAIVNDNVQLWQQQNARLSLTVGDLRTVRTMLAAAPSAGSQGGDV